MIKTETILLVEDSKFLRLATERILTKAGYRVICAGDGDEALVLAGSSVPDLIVLDMLLPKLSGPEVLRSLAWSSHLIDSAIPYTVYLLPQGYRRMVRPRLTMPS